MLKNKVLEDISSFERKRINQSLLRLGAGLVAATLLFFPVMSLLEYWFYLTPLVKSSILFGYSGVVLASLGWYVARPWWNLQKTQSLDQYETLSRTISSSVLSLDDKLINYLQMLGLSLKSKDSSLITYSLGQKQALLTSLNIPGQISVNIPVGLLKRIIPIALLGLLLFIGYFDFIKEGSSRLIHVTNTYVPPAPFTISVTSLPSRILANQPFKVSAKVSGPALPDQLLIKVGNRSIKMNREGNIGYVQTIDNLDVGTYAISVYSGNISSPVSEVEVLAPGQIEQLKIKIIPPPYTKREEEVLENEGNLEIPKGSQVTWNIQTTHLANLELVLGKSNIIPFQNPSDNQFVFESRLLQSSEYLIKPTNSLGKPDQALNYQIQIIEDEFPKIQVSTVQDSVSLQKQYFVGKVSDDYGFTQLRAVLQDPTSKKILADAPISINSSEKSQAFVYSPSGKVASIMAQKPVLLSFKIWDNDGVSGPKASSSATFDLKQSTKDLVTESVDRMENKNEENLEDLVKKTESMEKNSKKMLESLKGKKELNWQDKKELQNYVEKQKDLFKQIEDLKKEADKVLKNKQENNLQSEEMLEKQEQINKMLDELLDEKTKEMLKELERLLEEQNQNKDQLQDAFEKMQDKNELIQNELDRAMEMLKQLKVEEKLDKAIKDLDKLAEQQEKAGEQNEKKGDKQSAEEKKDAEQKQSEMNDMFKQIQDDVKQMQKINQDMQDKNDINTGEQEQKEIEESQEQSQEQMQQSKMQKAGGQQKKAGKKMKEMSKKMKDSQSAMQGGGDKEDIGDIRYIIENLLHLSFDQEEVYKEVATVNQLDPRYLALTQKQVKIKDDAQIIKDSLKAVARRVPEIQSFVMKELFAMDDAIDDAVQYVKARRPDIASAKGQMAMTNINNLTVMLKDALQQMQQQQQQQSGSKSCKKPGKGKPKPGSMGQMQKQLNDQISQLKNGKKPGQQMSQELAKLAQKQAAMRRALGELEKSMQKGKDKSGGLGDVKSQMEKTEKDLLSKKITPETIMRQQQILTRLLESEKAMMEREQEQKREAEKPKSTERSTLPNEIKELLLKSQSQREQLIQGAPKLTEMYQKAYDKYFESIQDRGL